MKHANSLRYPLTSALLRYLDLPHNHKYGKAGLLHARWFADLDESRSYQGIPSALVFPYPKSNDDEPDRS